MTVALRWEAGRGCAGGSEKTNVSVTWTASGEKDANGGALVSGIGHGAYCLGCCWFLMGLLFFGGIMNLFWIAGLAGFILLEKTVPMGHCFGRVAGVGFAAWGVLMLTGSVGGE